MKMGEFYYKTRRTRKEEGGGDGGGWEKRASSDIETIALADKYLWVERAIFVHYTKNS